MSQKRSSTADLSVRKPNEQNRPGATGCGKRVQSAATGYRKVDAKYMKELERISALGAASCTRNMAAKLKIKQMVNARLYYLHIMETQHHAAYS